MTISKQIFLSAIFLYTIIAAVISRFTNTSFIDIFNAFMLSCILFNLLDWKYGEEDSDD